MRSPRANRPSNSAKFRIFNATSKSIRAANSSFRKARRVIAGLAFAAAIEFVVAVTSLMLPAIKVRGSLPFVTREAVALNAPAAATIVANAMIALYMKVRPGEPMDGSNP